MRIIGLDLAGPKNHKDTVLTVFYQESGKLVFEKLLSNMSDEMNLTIIKEESERNEVVVGIDAPLSYEDGGGDRESDRSIRKFIISLGMRSGSIMAPTFNRMVYLTLRGIKLSREIGHLQSTHPISIVEVHPGAVMGARVAKDDLHHVLRYKTEVESRQFLVSWLKSQLLDGITENLADESHSIDACAAALGTWHWKDPDFNVKWLHRSKAPLHPFDYCC